MIVTIIGNDTSGDTPLVHRPAVSGRARRALHAGGTSEGAAN